MFFSHSRNIGWILEFLVNFSRRLTQAADEVQVLKKGILYQKLNSFKKLLGDKDASDKEWKK